MNPSTPQSAENPGVEDRRGFFLKLAAGAIGMLAVLIPAASGLIVFLDPLRRRTRSTGFVRVATLDSLPDDGIARRFPVIADRTDAWTHYPHEPIGAVYLRRVKDRPEIQALNAICPHAGCFYEFNAAEREFQCPCHNSRFAPDGTRIDPQSSPSPRDLDTLPIDPKKLAQGEIWIEFKNFLAGTPEKKER
jgi:menaquinol-cytochrome c reductase iron-sulfur subunit